MLTVLFKYEGVWRGTLEFMGTERVRRLGELVSDHSGLSVDFSLGS